MSWWKKSPKMKPKPFFCQNYWITSAAEKSSPYFWATFVIFEKKRPKENNQPFFCKNSPNLVTLPWKHDSRRGYTSSCLCRNKFKKFFSPFYRRCGFGANKRFQGQVQVKPKRPKCITYPWPLVAAKKPTFQKRNQFCTYVGTRTGLPDGIGSFKPKIPIWVKFGGHWNGKVWHVLWPFGLYYGH
jgi:hypothetical protein